MNATKLCTCKKCISKNREGQWVLAQIYRRHQQKTEEGERIDQFFIASSETVQRSRNATSSNTTFFSGLGKRRVPDEGIFIVCF